MSGAEPDQPPQERDIGVVVPRHHISLLIKLLAGWWVLMAPGLLYIGPWPWVKAVGLASVGLLLVFFIGEMAFGRNGKQD